MKESTTFHAGCKTLASALVCISSLYAASAFANVFDYSNSGIVKASSGAYYLVEGKNVTQISPEKAMSLQYKFPVNTSRGAQEVAFVRQATPYTPKIGAAVSTMAKRLGPLGMALTAADLVCSLSNICNQAGQWMLQPDPVYANYPAQTGELAYYCTGFGCFPNSKDVRSPDPSTACHSAVSAISTFTYVSNTSTSCTVKRVSDGGNQTSVINRFAGSCPPNYTNNSGNCVANFRTQSTQPSESDWSTAETKLNDNRFVDELAAKNEQVPINLPSIQNAPLRQLVSDIHEPQFDSLGTQTGTKRTLTELVIEDAATADKPNQINVKEETTSTYYDNTGNVIGTISKSTTEVSQSTPQPQSQLCGLPGQEPCNVKVDERGVDTAIAGLNPLGQAATTSVTSVFDSANNSILTRSGGVGSGMAWPWEVNAGSCSPLVIDAQKGLVLDICPHIPLIHSILGYVFYVLTAFSIFNVFFQPKTT